MELGLEGRGILVTGASGGIGRAVAEVLAGEGARVALHGNRRAAELRAWAAEQPWAERAVVVEGDVRDPDAMEAAADAAVRAFGRLDGCVANAGVWPPQDLRVDECPPARVRDTLEVNLLGSFWTARAFLRALSRSGPRADGTGAALVLVGSTAGRHGERGHADYAAAKAGLAGLALSLKNEIVALDPFGRVNVVEPGWTVTHMARPALDVPGNVARAVRTMALRQLARASDVARSAAFLLSPVAARHLTGQTLVVAGGMEGRVRWEPDEIDEDSIRRRARE